MAITRRQFIAAAAALGAGAAWARPDSRPSKLKWKEQRALYPQGVASGDPQPDSVILWTRRPFAKGAAPQMLTLEIARDAEFQQVVSTADVRVSEAADWTCRVLAGNLDARTVYWYRFTDTQGNGSRVGRTLTAPRERDKAPVKFAFVSCQTINEGAMNAYRRLLYEDRRAPAAEQLGFVLHLGDFIYEVVQYPDEVKTRYDRTIFDIGRIPDARKVSNFHVPTTLEGYRFVWQAHLNDPDIQDARAHLPFVAMWDNHEFSWQGWQSFTRFGSKVEPAQELKVAAMQAWFEYQPARVKKSGGASLETFDGPKVSNTPITTFDDSGLGLEPNNLAAIGSLTGNRTLRYGRNVELIITDQRSYRMDDPTNAKELEALPVPDLAGIYPEEVVQIVEGGRAYNNGKPPEKISFGGAQIDNWRKNAAPWTILGEAQRRWFIDTLKRSQATWKIWGTSTGTLDWRFDPQNLPENLSNKWPGGYGMFSSSDHGAAYAERGEIYDAIAREKITGFVSVAGDRHSFWAGYSAKLLPPKAFEPVGIAFVTGSISAAGMAEGYKYNFPKDHPLRPLFLVDGAPGTEPEPTMNMTMRLGVRSSLEYAKSRDLAKARALANPDNAPHLKFLDLAGHGYSTVRASEKQIETEFVCIPRPIHRNAAEDGGPLRYRVVHRAALWGARQKPVIESHVIEGDPGLAI